MNQLEMKSDKVHSHIPGAGRADANRLRRFAAGLGGLFCVICVLLPSPAKAQCREWIVSGKWRIQQGDLLVHVDLQQSGKVISGTAQYTSADKYKDTRKGVVAGTLDGNKISLDMEWNDGSGGIYTGVIGQTRVIRGTVNVDKTNPKNVWPWVSKELMRCADARATSSQQSGNFPNTAIVIPPQKFTAPAAPAQTSPKDKLQSGNPQDFAGTWNTTRRGETLILTLRVDGTNVTGEFTNPSRPTSNGTLTGTVKTYDGNFGPIAKLKYVTTQPTAGDGSFDVFTDGRLEGGFTWQEPGKTKKTFIRWNGTRASN